MKGDLEKAERKREESEAGPVEPTPTKKKDKKKKSLPALFAKALTDIMKQPISRWTTIGASFRYFGQFASDYYLPMFYLSVYPNMKAEFALVYSMINVFCGFVSSIAGGVLSDKLGKGRPMMNAWVCIFGNILAFPLFAASVLITDNFWLSIVFTALRFLVGEPYRSPSVTMIQNSAKPEKFGSLVSAYQFFQKMSAVLAAFVITALFSQFDVAASPAIIGRILAMIGGVAYLGSAGAYYQAGKHYIAFKRNLKYRSFMTFDRSKRGYDKAGFKPFDPTRHK